MKKVFILLAFIFVALMSYSVSTVRIIPSGRDKVLPAVFGEKDAVTWNYTGVAADTLTVNQDTILYNITINKAVPMNYYIKIGLDTIAGVDTICKVNINGRMFDDEAWTLIETVNTSAISGEINTVIESMTDPDYTYTIASHTILGTAFTATQDTATFSTYPADSIKFPAITFTEAAQTLTPVPSIKPCWRQLQVEIILLGDDSVGEGIKLKDIRWYFQEAK
jgi:hypothetical protein